MIEPLIGLRMEQGYVENYTLTELKQLLANDQFPVEYPNARIPTLRELLFEEFKGKEVEHIVEIKSGNPEIIDELIKLIKEMGVENQVYDISFNAAQYNPCRENPRYVHGFFSPVSPMKQM